MVNNNNWFVRAGGNRYRHVDGYKAVRLIDDCLKDYASPLNDRQKEVLRREFGCSGMLGNLDMPFQVLEWKQLPRDTTAGFWWRLTLPILFLWVIFFKCVVENIKWLFTGVRYFGVRSWIVIFNTRWTDKALGR